MHRPAALPRAVPHSRRPEMSPLHWALLSHHQGQPLARLLPSLCPTAHTRGCPYGSVSGGGPRTTLPRQTFHSTHMGSWRPGLLPAQKHLRYSVLPLVRNVWIKMCTLIWLVRASIIFHWMGHMFSLVSKPKAIYCYNFTHSPRSEGGPGSWSFI